MGILDQVHLYVSYAHPEIKVFVPVSPVKEDGTSRD